MPIYCLNSIFPGDKDYHYTICRIRLQWWLCRTDSSLCGAKLSQELSCLYHIKGGAHLYEREV